MKRSLPIIRGRGAGDDPPNRFDRLHVELDEEAGVEAVERDTQYFRDPSRSVLTRNDSPDVPFEWSLNPYRGCEHGCSYCIAPETPILFADLTWRPLWTVNSGDVLVGFDEFPEPGRTRKLRRSVVEDVWWSLRPTVRIVTERTEVITTAEHRWLQARNFRWSCTHQLAEGDSLRYLPASDREEEDDHYRIGYVAGISLGDATFRFDPAWRSDKLGFPAAYWRLALVDDEPLLRTRDYLRRFNVDVEVRPFARATETRRALKKIETRSLPKLSIINRLLEAERPTKSYRRGFLAGFFDAEGHNGTSLRLSQLDRAVLERVRLYARSLGLEFVHETGQPGRANTLRLKGSVSDRIQFFATCEPAIARKREAIFGLTPATVPDRIVAIEPGPAREVMDIRTSTGTFYAAGLATHNCYARPTHEYLGYSAGLDFETRILAKEDAPELLREALAKPSWRPTALAMSGVTDPYQPVERRLQITRRCLEVLNETRHPVTVITKSSAIERDVDILAALARANLVHATLSITTLDRALQRAMEPRAAPPEHRLHAIRTLAEAGVPVSVGVAPVIPGLTEHEIPSILEAAAAAGATRAGMIMLRLPGAVEGIFLSWLEEHLPDRYDRVLARLREVRGGRLSDPRFGSRMTGEGLYADQIRRLFRVSVRRMGLDREFQPLSMDVFQPPAPPRVQGRGRGRPGPPSEDAQLDLLVDPGPPSTS